MMVVFSALEFVVLGFLLGVTFFATLGWNVGMWIRRDSVILAIATHVARLLTAAMVFAAFAQAGAIELLSGFAGFLVARTVAIWIGRPEPKEPQ